MVWGKYYTARVHIFEIVIFSTMAKVQGEVLELNSRIRIDIKNIRI